MKKYLILFLAVVSSSIFVGCSSDDDFTPPNYVTMQAGPAAVGVNLNGSTTHEVTVYTANIVSSDRVFDIVVNGSSTLNAGAYSVPATVTVPGGTNEGTFTVEVSDVNINPNGDTLILGIAPGGEYYVGNTLTLNVSQLCDPEFRINFVFDGYASETTWDLTNVDGEVVFEGGGFTDGTATASVKRCINPGEYTFTVYDAYGDGLTYPTTGSITLLYGGEEITVIPGNFGEQTSFTFNTEGDSTGGDTDEEEGEETEG